MFANILLDWDIDNGLTAAAAAHRMLAAYDSFMMANQKRIVGRSRHFSLIGLHRPLPKYHTAGGKKRNKFGTLLKTKCPFVLVINIYGHCSLSSLTALVNGYGRCASIWVCGIVRRQRHSFKSCKMAGFGQLLAANSKNKFSTLFSLLPSGKPGLFLDSKFTYIGERIYQNYFDDFF